MQKKRYSVKPMQQQKEEPVIHKKRRQAKLLIFILSSLFAGFLGAWLFSFIEKKCGCEEIKNPAWILTSELKKKTA